MQSYDYEHRKGVEVIDWERFASLTRVLAEQLAAAEVDVVVGIARAGLLPATALACALRCELFPVRVTRRVMDVITYVHPLWKVDVSPEVAGRVVAVVDEIADTGETLALVAERTLQQGAGRVMTASLVSHSWASPAPHYVALVTDALVVFPWDREVYTHGTWHLHPELEIALRLQGKTLE